jgi:5'-nucleotidase
MRIILTNDDGLDSGALHEVARSLCSISPSIQLTVLAPAQQMSGVGHAFTFYKPLPITKVPDYPYECYKIDGTPADCVKWALVALHQEKPDLVISGPNEGENSGVAVVYSGTVAGAREGALFGVPSMALSMQQGNSQSVHFVCNWLQNFIRKQLYLDIKPHGYWNVNFPDMAQYEGEFPEDRMVFTNMSTVMFQDWYELVSEGGASSLQQLKGHKPQQDFKPQTDDFFHYQNWITISPLQVDQTDTQELERLRGKANSITASFTKGTQ